MLPFSFGGFYLAWKSTYAFFALDSFLSVLGGLAMLVIGMAIGLGPWYMALAPRIKSYHKAKDIYYLITNRRALILYIKDGRIKDYHKKRLSDIDQAKLRLWHSSGIGNVIFDSDGSYDPTGERPTTHYEIGFEGIERAEAVFVELQKAIGNASGKKSRLQNPKPNAANAR